MNTEYTDNKVIKRILSEGLTLNKQYKHENSFSYYGGRNMISYPAFKDLNAIDSTVYLAHELGHHYQYKNKSTYSIIFCNIALKNSIVSFFFYPFLLYTEVDAWIRAWRICKESGLSKKEFLPPAIRGIGSYFKHFITLFLQHIKILLQIYIGIVLVVGFLKMSHELNLNQPVWLIDIRGLVETSVMTYNEMVISVFTGLMFFWVFGLFLLSIHLFIFELIGAASNN